MDVTDDSHRDPAPVARAATRRSADRLLHLLLGSPCLGCGGALPARGDHLALCSRCRGRLRVPGPRTCTGCGRPLPGAAHPEPRRCDPCRRRPPAAERLLVGWLYREPLDAVVRALKFHRLDFVAEHLGRRLAERFAAELATVDAVVPVPLHWRRRLGRGYNQAALLARSLAAAAGTPVTAALARRRATPPQASLGRTERLSLVRREVGRSVFACRRPAAVAGRRVLLVDDVATTGATLEACGRCLLDAGAAAVVALAAALTPWPDQHGEPESRGPPA